MNLSYHQLWHQKNPGKQATYSKKYYEKDPNHAKRVKFRSHLKKTYGISLEEYDTMIVQQNSQCAACRSKDSGRKSGAWTVDHNHETGQVRGLLCHKCNIALGYIEDSKRLEQLMEYLNRFK